MQVEVACIAYLLRTVLIVTNTHDTIRAHTHVIVPHGETEVPPPPATVAFENETAPRASVDPKYAAPTGKSVNAAIVVPDVDEEHEESTTSWPEGAPPDAVSCQTPALWACGRRGR